MNTYGMTRSPLDEAELITKDDIESGYLPADWMTEIDLLIFRNLECAEDHEYPEVLSLDYMNNLNT